MSKVAASLAVALILSSAACGSSAPPPLAPEQSAKAAGDDAAQTPESDEATRDLGPIPVSTSDPEQGDRDAPVTWIVFGDLTGAETKKIVDDYAAMAREVGRNNIHFVWKLASQPHVLGADSANEVGEKIFVHAGPRAFWAYFDFALAHQPSLTTGDRGLGAAVRAAGLNVNDVTDAGHDKAVRAKIDGDAATLQKIGAPAVASSFINGVRFTSADGLDKLRPFFHDQLARAKELEDRGLPKAKIAAYLAQEQFVDNTPPPELADKHVWAIPVGASPVRGPKDALVTIVEFAEFQCPYCAKAAVTMNKLFAAYPGKLRLVFKSEPLDFHPHAEPAAEVALEARAEKGDEAFFAIHDAVFADPSKLEDPSLLAMADDLKLDKRKVEKAMRDHTHAREIEDEDAVADDFDATATPTFFVNGRRIGGAQKLHVFQALVDEELAKAEAKVASGTPKDKLYDAIVASGEQPPPPEKVNVGAPPKDAPAMGAAKAKVTIQVFAEFQCPFCRIADAKLVPLEKEFHGQVRIVWRHYPLSMHEDAEPAAEASIEAYLEKGDQGFWSMHDLLLAGQRQPGGLKRPALLGYGAQLGLDPGKLAQAIDKSKYKSRLDADVEVATKAHISSTPTFVVGDYVLTGAQPMAKLRRAVRRALADAK